MFLTHRSKKSVYNYDDIPAGYYYQIMSTGSKIQRFWHEQKFKTVADKIPNSKSILDFGCGPGSFIDILSKTKSAFSAVGVDIGSCQIEFAKNNIEKKNQGQSITFQALTPHDGTLEFEDSSFDYVTAIEVIEHVHPAIAHKFLRESRRILKEDGTIIITTPNYRSFWPILEFIIEKVSPIKYHDQHISKFTPSSFVKFVESAGFKVNRIHSIFFISPFLAPISKKLANFLLKHELKHNRDLGSLLIMEASKDTDL